MTPLLISCRKGYAKLVSLLLEFGATIPDSVSVLIDF
jgi:ankyrin repeat protein